MIAMGLLNYLSSMNIEAYALLRTLLNILLALPVCVTSCERSLKKLKLIKELFAFNCRIDEKLFYDNRNYCSCVRYATE